MEDKNTPKKSQSSFSALKKLVITISGIAAIVGVILLELNSQPDPEADYPIYQSNFEVGGLFFSSEFESGNLKAAK